MRSSLFSGRLQSSVQQLWGGPIHQAAPRFTVQVPGADRSREVLPASNLITVDLDLEHRKKGLNWYATYTCAFDAVYEIRNDEAVSQKVRVSFDFPNSVGTYDGVFIQLDEMPLHVPLSVQDGLREIVVLAPGASRQLRIRYTTRGLGNWVYRLSAAGRVRNLELNLNTDFQEVDYPVGGLSPTSAIEKGEGMRVQWKAEDLLTTQVVGMILPDKLNPGPLSGRITFFAPVCLLFYFVLTMLINVKWQLNIHPMHYLFIAAGFFAFHLLFAYMVDLFDIHVSFITSALTSMALVVAYLRAALGKRFPWRLAAAAQLVYLVLFSYSFFFKGITGFIITLGSILTLGLLMAFTAGTDWNLVFVRKSKAPVLPSGPPPIGGEVA